MLEPTVLAAGKAPGDATRPGSSGEGFGCWSQIRKQQGRLQVLEPDQGAAGRLWVLEPDQGAARRLQVPGLDRGAVKKAQDARADCGSSGEGSRCQSWTREHRKGFGC